MSQVMSLLSSKPCNGSLVTQNEMKANTFAMGCKFDEVYTTHTPTRAPLPQWFYLLLPSYKLALAPKSQPMLQAQVSKTVSASKYISKMPASLHCSAWHRAHSKVDTQNKDKYVSGILFEVLYKKTKDWHIIIDISCCNLLNFSSSKG